jgi:hypothetical protein
VRVWEKEVLRILKVAEAKLDRSLERKDTLGPVKKRID